MSILFASAVKTFVTFVANLTKSIFAPIEISTKMLWLLLRFLGALIEDLLQGDREPRLEESLQLKEQPLLLRGELEPQLQEGSHQQGRKSDVFKLV